MTNILLRDNKYSGYANLRFYRFHKWENMTHRELQRLGRRHQSNLKKIANEFILNFDPVKVCKDSVASPAQWFLSKKIVPINRYFTPPKKTGKSMNISYNKKDTVEALDFFHNIGKNASDNFVFSNNEFPSLWNSKDFGAGSHSDLSALKKSSENEPPPTPLL